MDYANEATSYMLADAVDVRPSQKFRDILNEMVGEGILKVEERDQSGRFTTKFYSLVDGAHYHEKFSRRHISVRSRGQVVGQMEMFS